MAVPSTSSSLPDLTTQPQPRGSVWVRFWVVDAVFAASADDEASFDCETEPSLPGLSTRTEMFSFEGWTWVALDAAIAPWVVSEDCVPDCTGPPANAVVALAARAATVTTSIVNSRFIEGTPLISLVSRAIARARKRSPSLPRAGRGVIDAGTRATQAARQSQHGEPGELEEEPECKRRGDAAAGAAAAAGRRSCGAGDRERGGEAQRGRPVFGALPACLRCGLRDVDGRRRRDAALQRCLQRLSGPTGRSRAPKVRARRSRPGWEATARRQARRAEPPPAAWGRSGVQGALGGVQEGVRGAPVRSAPAVPGKCRRMI